MRSQTVKTSGKWLYFALVLVLAAFISACGSSEKDKVEMVTEGEIEEVSPDWAQVLFENEVVKAVTIELPRGATLPFHPGKERILFALNDFSITTNTHSTVLEKMYARGQVEWEDMDVKKIKNTGENRAKYMIIYRTTPPLPGVAEPKDLFDLSAMACEFANILLDNNKVKVHGVYLPSGQSIPMHDGTNRLVYSHNLYNLKVGEPVPEDSTKMKTMAKEFQPGELNWHTRGQHMMENTGLSMAHYTIFSFKE